MIRYFFLLLFSCSLICISGCNKRGDFHEIQNKPESIVEKFLQVPNNNIFLTRLSDYLRVIERKKPFISEFVQKFGYPKWEKVVMDIKHGRSINSPDSLVLVPVVNNERVTSYFAFKINDSIKARLFNPGNYWHAGFSGNDYNANTVMAFTIFLENKVFGRKYFYIKDGRLFNPPGLYVDSSKTLSLSVENIGLGRSTTDMFEFRVSFYPTNPSEPNTWYVAQYFSQLSLWYNTNYPNNNSNYTNLEFIDPLENGYSPNMIPTIFDNLAMVIEQTSIENNLTVPCLKNMVDFIGLNKHKSVIFNIYRRFNAPSLPIIIKYTEAASVVSNGQEVIAKTNFAQTADNDIWEIKLNSTLLQGKPKEYVLSVILHEIGHVIVQNAIGNLAPAVIHYKMVDGNVCKEIGVGIKELFPLVDQNDAYSLSIGGMKEAFYDSNNNPINPELWNKIQAEMGITPVSAAGIIDDYKNGNKGTICN